jgi:pimeloyl-ACP methyl ester carboxylesterase
MGFLSRPVTADLVAELIAERVPTGRAHVVALSWGGGVAHTLLDRHPDRVDRAVIDGAGVLTARSDRAVGDRASGAALLLGVDMSEAPRPPGRPRHRTTKEEPAGLCLLAGLGVTPARRRP